jgi:hypothetical protein
MHGCTCMSISLTDKAGTGTCAHMHGRTCMSIALTDKAGTGTCAHMHDCTCMCTGPPGCRRFVVAALPVHVAAMSLPPRRVSRRRACMHSSCMHSSFARTLLVRLHSSCMHSSCATRTPHADPRCAGAGQHCQAPQQPAPGRMGAPRPQAGKRTLEHAQAALDAHRLCAGRAHRHRGALSPLIVPRPPMCSAHLRLRLSSTRKPPLPPRTRLL